MSLQRDFSKTSSLQASYSRRIQRPTFGQLAPFFTFVEPQYYIGGNDRLLPTFSDNGQATYRFRQNVRTLALSFSFPVKAAGWWQMQNSVQGVRQQAQLTLDGSTQREARTYLNVTSTQTFTLGGDFSAELSGFFQSRSLFGVMERRPYGALNVGVQKKLPKNQGTVRLTGEDVFWTNVLLLNTDNPEEGYTATFVMRSHSRLVRLSFTRPFGNQGVSVIRRTTGADEERRVN